MYNKSNKRGVFAKDTEYKQGASYS